MRRKKVDIDVSFDGIKGKKELHEYADRRGYKVPPLIQAATTIEYLRKVIKEQVWCPSYSQVQLRSCYAPPKKELILK